MSPNERDILGIDLGSISELVFTASISQKKEQTQKEEMRIACSRYKRKLAMSGEEIN